MLPPSRTLASGMIPEVISPRGKPRTRIIDRTPTTAVPSSPMADLEEDWGEDSHHTVVSIRVEQFATPGAAQAAEDRILAQVNSRSGPYAGTTYRINAVSTTWRPGLGDVTEVRAFEVHAPADVTDLLLTRGQYFYTIAAQQLSASNGVVLAPAFDPQGSLSELLTFVGTRPTA
jgi:hypothetical protein